MPRELTEKHKQAMQAGRRKAGEAKRQAAIARVKAFSDWCEDDALNGSPGNRKPIPAIPSSSDYSIARAAGEYNRGAVIEDE